MTEQAIYSWFSGDKRVSIYPDGTVEIQARGSAYRAAPDLWIRAAVELNCLVSHYRADLIQEAEPHQSCKSEAK